MNTQRNRFIRRQMKRWKRQHKPMVYAQALDQWITHLWLGMHY